VAGGQPAPAALERADRHPQRAGRDDAARFNDLTLAGYGVLRFTWRDVVEDGERVVAELRDALAARGVWS
jgi:very-short-patch-repair endonuclease